MFRVCFLSMFMFEFAQMAFCSSTQIEDEPSVYDQASRFCQHVVNTSKLPQVGVLALELFVCRKQ